MPHIPCAARPPVMPLYCRRALEPKMVILEMSASRYFLCDATHASASLEMSAAGARWV